VGHQAVQRHAGVVQGMTSQPQGERLALSRAKTQARKYQLALVQITNFTWTSPSHGDVNEPVPNCYCGGCCMVRTALSVLPKARKS
jgi:hypothetical protein